jgi:hypothetical protein
VTAANRRQASWYRILARTGVAFFAFIIIFPLLYTLIAPESRAFVSELPSVPAGSYKMYVVDWGYHTAIVAQQPAGWALGPPGQEHSAYIEYAWGDRSFYLNADYRPHVLFATVVLPTPTVMYVGGYSDPPRFPGARAVFYRAVDAATLRALLLTLEQSIQRRQDGTRVDAYPRTAAAFTGRFYPAHGSYLWPRDCNWWTVKRLNEVGLATGPLGVLFSGQVPGRLTAFARDSVTAR